MAERFETLLGMGDEKWAVIGPKVLKVRWISLQTLGGQVRMQMGRRHNQGNAASQGNVPSGGMMMNNRAGGGAADESIQALQTLLHEGD